MSARRVLACVIATSALVAGCGSDTEGSSVSKVTEYTEPSVSTPRTTPIRPPTTTTTPSSVPPTTTTAGPPPGAEVLPPENGYAFIQSKSGKTRCQISTSEVGCESQFTNPPDVDGEPANGVNLTADGQIRWLVGNLGDIPAVTLDYKTYWAQGWTIEAGEDGTRFTNDRTRHGMLVAVEKVDTF
jgi:hypothetical protein